MTDDAQNQTSKFFAPRMAELYLAREVATLFRMSLAGVYAAVARGDLPSIRLGRRILFPKKAIDRILSGETAEAETRAE